MGNWSRAATAAGGRHRRRRSQRAGAGQSLTEFALVLPVLVAVLGGIIQFGMIFWAQNTVTQVVRDIGRFAATQNYCTIADSGAATPTLLAQANTIANSSSLIGYTYGASGQWTTLDAYPESSTEGVAVSWTKDYGAAACPPKDNQSAWFVTVQVRHVVPVFFPGLQYLPGLGTCNSSGCSISLTSTAQFRMEPSP